MNKDKQLPLQNTEETITEEKKLILHNDDVNTFDHVIETLIEICEHDNIQAEQCALIAHFKGKCVVKTGVLYQLQPLKTAMLEKKLSVSIG